MKNARRRKMAQNNEKNRRQIINYDAHDDTMETFLITETRNTKRKTYISPKLYSGVEGWTKIRHPGLKHCVKRAPG